MKIIKKLFYVLNVHLLIETIMLFRIYHLAWRKRNVTFDIGPRVCIVGTGPSLDISFIERQENLTFIFLNAAVQLEKHIKPSCKSIWFASDSRAVYLYNGLRAKHVPLICVVSDLLRFSLIFKFIHKRDKVYLPYLVIGREWWRKSKNLKLHIIPNYLQKPLVRRKRFGLSFKTRFQLYSGTVSSNALMYCLDAGVTEVTLTGVDLLTAPEKFAAHSEAIHVPINFDTSFRVDAAIHAQTVLLSVANNLKKNGIKLLLHLTHFD
ncbi:hypothetical protein N9R24_00005 [Amylibacter sp.]|nr:hypothetical protein [Amylibacter sp.]